MKHLQEALANTSGSHLTALEWFVDRSSRNASWTEMQRFSAHAVRIVNQAKGIYRPAGSEYALSVRQTLNGPYADRPILDRSDGTWQFHYYQENADPAQRDREATNRGLMNCMASGIPVGVLVQLTPKPGVTYRVQGLALVSDWQDGYFILEGFSVNGIARTPDDVSAARLRGRYEEIAATEDSFDPADVFDERERLIAEVVRRRGQGEFRRKVLEAYRGCCAISGCNLPDALEAAHIQPYRGAKSNVVSNGMMLRADIHNLYDLGLIAVDITTMRIVVAERLLGTEYAAFSGKPLQLPDCADHQPSAGALAAHRAWAGL